MDFDMLDEVQGNVTAFSIHELPFRILGLTDLRWF